MSFHISDVDLQHTAPFNIATEFEACRPIMANTYNTFLESAVRQSVHTFNTLCEGDAHVGRQEKHALDFSTSTSYATVDRSVSARLIELCGLGPCLGSSGKLLYSNQKV